MCRILDYITQILNCRNLNLNSIHLKCAVYTFVDFSARHGIIRHSRKVTHLFHSIHSQTTNIYNYYKLKTKINGLL